MTVFLPSIGENTWLRAESPDEGFQMDPQGSANPLLMGGRGTEDPAASSSTSTSVRVFMFSSKPSRLVHPGLGHGGGVSGIQLLLARSVVLPGTSSHRDVPGGVRTRYLNRLACSIKIKKK